MFFGEGQDVYHEPSARYGQVCGFGHGMIQVKWDDDFKTQWVDEQDLWDRETWEWLEDDDAEDCQ